MRRLFQVQAIAHDDIDDVALTLSGRGVLTIGLFARPNKIVWIDRPWFTRFKGLFICA